MGNNDFFRINVTRVGMLLLSTTGTTDTYGRLLSSSASQLAFNDDSVGVNFGISFQVTAGTYHVQVSHYSGTGTGAYQLVASLAGSPRQLYDDAAVAAGLAGADADPDSVSRNDGIRNILKYAFNLDLAAPDARMLEPGSGTAGQPSVGLEGAGQSRTLKVEYLRRRNSGLIYQPKWSSSLDPQGFIPMSGTPTVATINLGWDRVVVRQSFGTDATPRAFALVEVVIP